MRTFCATYQNDPGKAKRPQEFIRAVSWSYAAVRAERIGVDKGYNDLVSLELCAVIEPGTSEYEQWSNTKGD